MRLNSQLEELRKENPFQAGIIDNIELDVSADHTPTACVGLHPQTKELFMSVNPKFFDTLTHPEQVSILKHEVMHITHYHMARGKEKQHMLFNIAADMAINQLIDDLPKDALYPEKDMDLFSHTEYYYEEVKKKARKIKGDKGFFDKLGEAIFGDGNKGKPIDDHSKWGKVSSEDAQKATDEAISKSIKENGVSRSELASVKKERSKSGKVYGSKGANGSDPFELALESFENTLDWKK